MSIPILDLSLANDPGQRQVLLHQLRDALFNVGFLYVKNHGVPANTVASLADRLPALFGLSDDQKARLSKLNSPHFLGYSGFAEETTLGKQDLREQFDYATELPTVYDPSDGMKVDGRDFSQPYWRLRGPNQFPDDDTLPGFREALLSYIEALSDLSYRVVHLVEEAFGIPVGTFDDFFRSPSADEGAKGLYLCAQHRMKLVKYPALGAHADSEAQGVGAHKDSSGWLTFLHQVGTEPGLEVLSRDGSWIPASPVRDTFVVNFGNAFEAATEGAVRATTHRVKAPRERDRYSIPFFMGLPLNLKVSDMRTAMPLRRESEDQSAAEASVSAFLDPRWDTLGESQLRKWIRSHREVGLKWYGLELVAYYSD